MSDKNKLHLSSDKAWHTMPVSTVISFLHSDAGAGLSTELVKQNLEVVGNNELPHKNLNPWWRMLLRQFTSPLVYVLLLAAVVTIWLGEIVDALVIALVVLVNTIIGFAQEYQSSRILEELKQIVKVNALTVRDGSVKEIDAINLVPGDIVILKTGQKVPADIRLINVQEFSTSESLLTGESVPVVKSISPVTRDVSLGDKRNMVFMGTVVEAGNARGVVVATGSHTELGKIAQLTQTSDSGMTPLQQRLNNLAKIITIFVIVAAVVILVVGVQGYLSFVEAFQTAVAVAIAAIPEGLLAALSVVLAVSTKRILRKNGLVRRPVAAETLGSTTTIVTDKTGTLTIGEMKVEQTSFEGHEKKALLSLMLANEAEIESGTGKVVVHGEATDKAKLVYALEHGLNHAEINKNYISVATLPFDQHTKMIAKFVKSNLQPTDIEAYVSGAPEILLNISATIGEYDILSESDKDRILKEVEELAQSGYRLIGVADKNIQDSIDPNSSASLKAALYDLNFRGIVALRDPIREDVLETLNLTRQAGVKVIMATGDHKLTAEAIAKDLGFDFSNKGIISGQEIDDIDDTQLKEVVKKISVCYRVDPEHKLRIVKALLENGESVAMTGDGVNDAPALNAADIGVAVAEATDVTKEAADLVLLKDGLSTIVDAIREGRIAFDNIRKVTTFLLSGTFTAFIFVMTSFIFGTPLPLTAVMILWANLVENGLPTFGLAFEKGEDNVMQRKPEPRSAAVLNKESKITIFVVSILRDILLLTVFFWYYNNSNYELNYIQTLVFAIISIDSLIYIYSIKSFHKPIWKENLFDNKYLVMSVVVGLFLAGIAIYVPVFNQLLGTVPLELSHIALVAVITLFEIFLYESMKFLYRTKIFSKQAA